MSEQMGMLFFVLFVGAAALCVYLSLSMSRARYFGERPPARHTNGILGMHRLIAATVTRRATWYSPARKRQHVTVFDKRTWDGVARFAVVLVRP
jgi:hypothetical protein